MNLTDMILWYMKHEDVYDAGADVMHLFELDVEGVVLSKPTGTSMVHNRSFFDEMKNLCPRCEPSHLYILDGMW